MQEMDEFKPKKSTMQHLAGRKGSSSKSNRVFASGSFGEVAWGCCLGYCAGYTLKQVGKTAALGVGCVFFVVQGLARLGYGRPSTAQSDAFGPISRGENLLLAHAGGMGKTLAFVAPLVQKLWQWEELEGRTPAGEVRPSPPHPL